MNLCCCEVSNSALVSNELPSILEPYFIVEKC